ncbi:hypothetical protein T265_02846 [Opisthorchis viverrini]|uniref:Uncharacterized protein n=1 Tax=Opisthorchis viverrini TaxID=6198 RepID=A0A074ZXV9_OPIVI|nr:hypothetical protein T265_02846 [Opisthorchis viverrini]KER30807.1 hypothetical protein T265_02846 [Opisthorchis viverrini]
MALVHPSHCLKCTATFTIPLHKIISTTTCNVQLSIPPPETSAERDCGRCSYSSDSSHVLQKPVIWGVKNCSLVLDWVCVSNPTCVSRVPLLRLGQPGSIQALVQPLGGMAARHGKLGQPGSIQALVQPLGGMAARHGKCATAERFLALFSFTQSFLQHDIVGRTQVMSA